MFRQELYKSFRRIEIFIIFVACILFEVISSSKNTLILPKDVNMKIYRYYINQLKGEYTEEKNQWIISERDNYQKYIDDEEKYKEQYDNDEITGDEYRVILDNIKSAEARIGTLNYLVEKSEYLKKIEESNCEERVEYFYDFDVNEYVENMGVDLAVILLLIIVVVHIFNEDYSCGTVSMIKTSVYGRRQLFRNRLFCTLLASGFIGFLFPIVELVVKNRIFDLGNMDAGIGCLNSMGDSGMVMSIKGYIILSIVIRGISAIIFGIIVMGISELIHNNIVCYVLSIASVYLLDIMYEHIGILKKIALCKGFAVYKGFSNMDKMLGVHSMVVWCVLYVILATVIVLYSFYKSEK